MSRAGFTYPMRYALLITKREVAHVSIYVLVYVWKSQLRVVKDTENEKNKLEGSKRRFV